MDIVFDDQGEGVGNGLADQPEPMGEVCQASTRYLGAPGWLRPFPMAGTIRGLQGSSRQSIRFILPIAEVGGIAYHLRDALLQAGRVGLRVRASTMCRLVHA